MTQNLICRRKDQFTWLCLQAGKLTPYLEQGRPNQGQFLWNFRYACHICLHYIESIYKTWNLKLFAQKLSYNCIKIVLFKSIICRWGGKVVRKTWWIHTSYHIIPYDVGENISHYSQIFHLGKVSLFWRICGRVWPF